MMEEQGGTIAGTHTVQCRGQYGSQLVVIIIPGHHIMS